MIDPTPQRSWRKRTQSRIELGKRAQAFIEAREQGPNFPSKLRNRDPVPYRSLGAETQTASVLGNRDPISHRSRETALNDSIYHRSWKQESHLPLEQWAETDLLSDLQTGTQSSIGPGKGRPNILTEFGDKGSILHLNEKQRHNL